MGKTIMRVVELLRNANKAYSASDISAELKITEGGTGRILPKLFEKGLVACRMGRPVDRKMKYLRFYAYKDRTRLLESADSKEIVFADNVIYVKKGFENDFEQTISCLLLPIKSIKDIKKIH